MSDNERFTVKDESHQYFTIIPNIILEIGLKPIDLAIYVALKRCAGDHGNCTRSYKNIAKLVNTSERTAINSITRLSEDNSIIGKPLIKKQKRLSECGDSETNCIIVTDVWKENESYFQNKIGGGAKSAPPSAKSAPGGAKKRGGVVQNLHQGGAKSAPKEEPFKKNPLKKTTTPTSSIPKVVVVVFSDEEKKQINEFLKNIEKEAMKMRRRYIAPQHWEEECFGKEWIFPIEYMEKKISEYGLQYVKDQINYMLRTQTEFFSGKLKRGIYSPRKYFKTACEKDYADLNQKK